VREVAQRLEMSVSGVKEAIYRGELAGEVRNRPVPGRPPLMVREAEVERFLAARNDAEWVALPQALRDVIMPLVMAGSSVRRFPQRLNEAAQTGRLRATRFRQVRGRQPQWYVRLGDLEAYLTRPERGRRKTARIFDRRVIEQLAGLLGEAQESGLPLGETQAAEA
jgi:hypothetical protein